MMENRSMQLPSALSGGTDGDHYTGVQIKAMEIRATKEWQQNITQDLRDHLVKKLVQALFPAPDPAALQDRRMIPLVGYACKVEGELYEAANSREEYYHFIAEKVYKTQKDLDEKRKQRRQQQETQQNLGGAVRDAPGVGLQPHSTTEDYLLGGTSTISSMAGVPLRQGTSTCYPVPGSSNGNQQGPDHTQPPGFFGAASLEIPAAMTGINTTGPQQSMGISTASMVPPTMTTQNQPGISTPQSGMDSGIMPTDASIGNPGMKPWMEVALSAIVGAEAGKAMLPGQEPVRPNRNIIWRGQLEWQDKKAIAPGQNSHITRGLGCMVSIAVTDPETNTANWPRTLIMQLMPQTLLNSDQLHPLFKNSKHIAFHFQNTDSEDLKNLHKVLGNGFAGIVHFPPNTVYDIRVMLLLFSTKRKSFVGLIPNDQNGVVNGIRQVITQHKQRALANTDQQGATVGTKPETSVSGTDHDNTALDKMLDERQQQLPECIICMEDDKRADCVFCDCGHLVTCMDCAASLHRCPVCRKKIKKRMKVYT